MLENESFYGKMVAMIEANVTKETIDKWMMRNLKVFKTKELQLLDDDCNGSGFSMIEHKKKEMKTTKVKGKKKNNTKTKEDMTNTTKEKEKTKKTKEKENNTKTKKEMSTRNKVNEKDHEEEDDETTHNKKKRKSSSATAAVSSSSEPTSQTRRSLRSTSANEKDEDDERVMTSETKIMNAIETIISATKTIQENASAVFIDDLQLRQCQLLIQALTETYKQLVSDGFSYIMFTTC